MNLRKAGCFILALMLCTGAALGCAKETEPTPSESPTQTFAAEPAPSSSPTPSPTPTPYTELAEGAQGAEVQHLQEALMELGYLIEDEATDYYGSMTRAAVAAFQKQNDLQPDGIAGEETQKLLYSGTAKECDPFSKFAPTVGMTFEELVMSDDGTRDQYPEGFPAADTYKIIVDIEHQVTMVYSQDENGEYTVPVRYMLCSTGKDDCTPKGTFKMDNYHVRFSQFARDKTYGQYWTQIRGAIYFHTILYEEFDTSTYIEEVWEKLGTADSHGCIRLTVPDAKWMWFNIAPGTVCVIRDGDPGDEETAAIRKQLVLADMPEERPDIDPQDIPSTDNWSPEDVAHDVPFVQGSQD
ncbi:L,D-transpeptidase family protein [Christensenella tenuis]|jgi:lipoprotein-anchoring transpeptidase ErfK/SrfK|uniref:Murein L,D-transpeptidase n=1 Tax=Christensenella tenuis TaxID=2763033 RepID=A0ABR7EED1_9FIRM|nr:L,D-transpeptidase family protein [Christensenella tenuis]MBC5648023.1 murein L,D-transpeptidase [Christensenella tenuis]